MERKDACQGCDPRHRHGFHTLISSSRLTLVSHQQDHAVGIAFLVAVAVLPSYLLRLSQVLKITRIGVWESS